MAEARDVFENDTPHGLMKRIIYKKNLQGFIPKILQSQPNNNVIIFDGFAGTGKYGEEWPNEIEKLGSPLIALRVAIQYFIPRGDGRTFTVKRLKEDHQNVKPKKMTKPMTQGEIDELEKGKVTFYFVEKKPTNFSKLLKNVCSVLEFYDLNSMLILSSHNVITIKVIDDQFPVICHLFWSTFQNIPCPTVLSQHYSLAFIDPFGFNLTLSKIAEFIGPRKDAMFNFMSSSVHRFVKVKFLLVARLFGIDIPEEVSDQGDKYVKEHVEQIVFKREADDLPQMSNVDILVKNFCKALHDKVRSNMSLVFEMKNNRNCQLYHLIFIILNKKGYIHMKEVMASCNQDKDFTIAKIPSLSDFRILKNNLSLDLGKKQDNEMIAGLIFDRFQGQSDVTGVTVANYVYFETPFVFRKVQLQILEYNNPPCITVHDLSGLQRRRGTYARLQDGQILLNFEDALPVWYGWLQLG